MGGKPDAETLAAQTVAAGLGTSAAKSSEADQLFRYGVSNACADMC